MLRTPTVPRKCGFSYGTSSCVTYFKLREHLIFFGRCDLDDLEMAASFILDRKTFKKYNFYSS